MTITIDRVLGSTPMRDGQYVSVSVELESGERTDLRMPTEELDWMAHNLYVAALNGFSAQTNANANPAVAIPADVVADTAQALSAFDGVVLGIAGAERSTRRAVMSSVFLSKSAAKVLALELLSAVDD